LINESFKKYIYYILLDMGTAYPLMWSHVSTPDAPMKPPEPLPEYYQTSFKYQYSNFEREEYFYDDSNYFGNPFADEGEEFKSKREYMEEEDSNYSVLGLKRSASDEDIKQAFRTKVLEVHPDKPGGSNEEFIKVREAYECLIS
jgi:hypothetical protein